MTPYDGFGALLTDPGHVPYVRHWPGTLESPEEISVTCSCGWGYESIAGAGGGCDTAWAEPWEAHLEETGENGDDA